MRRIIAPVCVREFIDSFEFFSNLMLRVEAHILSRAIQ